MNTATTCAFLIAKLYKNHKSDYAVIKNACIYD